jgi:aryl-alcohol dehydrogenase-like predicted oxidoreductase
LIRGGAARGPPADDKDWQQGPLGLSAGEGHRRWEASGVEHILDGMSRMEFVIRFTLSHPGLSTTIIGTSSLDHLASNLAIAEKGPLPPDLYERAKRVLDQESAPGS